MSDFKAKMHQIRFPLGLRPRPRWGSLQCSPNLAVFKGPTSKGREGEGRGQRKRGGKGGESCPPPPQLESLGPPVMMLVLWNSFCISLIRVIDP